MGDIMKTTKKMTRKQLLQNLEKLREQIKNYECNHVFLQRYVYIGENYHDINKNMMFLSKKEALKTLSNINKELKGYRV